MTVHILHKKTGIESNAWHILCKEKSIKKFTKANKLIFFTWKEEGRWADGVEPDCDSCILLALDDPGNVHHLWEPSE